MRNSFNPVKGPSQQSPGNGERGQGAPEVWEGCSAPRRCHSGASLLKAQPSRQPSFAKPGLWHPREAAGTEPARSEQGEASGRGLRWAPEEPCWPQISFLWSPNPIFVAPGSTSQAGNCSWRIQYLREPADSGPGKFNNLGPSFCIKQYRKCLALLGSSARFSFP